MKKTIEFETTKKDLTHLSGLIFFQRLVKSISLDSVIGQKKSVVKKREYCLETRTEEVSEEFGIQKDGAVGGT
ncbi:MAG: hypothetical protein QF441_03155 [Bacteriovoracaceae bacterium]|nr:hypothetical protein [Bacteriovoracaceae bacterium]